ncbi:hypothetical protein [Promicromonospora kroppenstedtii]|uniref:hypothetical protein n=1 Tax=Promicromonospora kroppenstedtii TaxID=440482 RepID=UPI0004BC6477|nr:hypothetical protein [Promicromonospora kroppenstedtii]
MGSREEVTDLVARCHDAGFDELVLSGHPHLEEAYRFAEGVRPILDARGITPQAAQDPRPGAATGAVGPTS